MPVQEKGSVEFDMRKMEERRPMAVMLTILMACPLGVSHGGTQAFGVEATPVQESQLMRPNHVQGNVQSKGRDVSAPDVALLGLWITHHDETQEPMAMVRLSIEAGHLSGRIETILDPRAKPGERCELCSDDRHRQTLLGLEIIRTGEWDVQNQRWQKAFILDPENGHEYRLSLTPMNGGRSLQVRGHWGVFWRNQVWTRVP